MPWPRPATRGWRISRDRPPAAATVGLPGRSAWSICATTCVSASARVSGKVCGGSTNWPCGTACGAGGDLVLPLLALLEKAVAGGRLKPAEGLRAAGVARPGGAGGRAADAAAPPPSRAVSHLQHRPQHQLHERLHRRLPLLRLLAARRATRKATSRSPRACCERSSETVDLGGDQILMQGGMHPELSCEWYEELLADIKGASRRSTSTASARRKSTTLPVSRAAGARGARAAEGGGPGQPAGRRGRDPGRSRAQEVSPARSHRRLARRLPRLARPGRPRHGHDDVRPRGNAGRADRALERLRRCRTKRAASRPSSPGRFSPATPHGPSAKAGAFEYLKTLAVSRLVSRQFPQHPVMLGHAGAEDRRRWPCSSGPTTWAA